ncbi:MAG: PEP-CTERM sorting domain-containing protein, partial [Terriglobales bacterium]
DTSENTGVIIEQSFQGNGPIFLNSSGTIIDLPSGEGDGVTGGKLVDLTPEPSSILLLASGALGLLGLAWRRRGAALA